MSPADDPLIEIRDLVFAWPGARAPVLAGVELTVERGRSVFVQGPSGSGKSTLLNLLGGVLAPQGGTLRVLGRDMATLSGAERDALRADQVGFLFQQFNLVPYLSVIENVLLPCRFSAARRGRVEATGRSLREEAERGLTELGLAAEVGRPVTALSVGQQQRVAAARALIGEPALVIADEPTSALDANRRDAFVEQLFASCRASGAGLVFVSHDERLGRHFDAVVDLPTINRGRRGEEVVT